MLSRFLALLAALLIAAPVQAQPVTPQTITPVFWHGSSGVVPGNCPNGTGDPNDGCLVISTSAQVSLPTFLSSYAFQTGQSPWSSNPNGDAAVVTTPWNAACIQFKCGPTIARASAIDPQNASNIPVGCTLSDPTGSYADYGLLNCSGISTTTTWNGMDFGTAFGHGPTFINFHSSVTGAQIFTNDYYTTDAGCHMAAQGVWILAQSGSSESFTFNGISYDGNDPTCRLVYQGGIELLTTGTVLIENFYFKHTEARVFTIQGGSTQNQIRWGVIDGWNYNAQAHGEIDTAGPATSQTLPLDIDHVVALAPSGGMCACSTTSWYISNGVSGNMGAIVFDHDIVVTNTISGTTGANGASVSYTLTQDGTGACTTAPNGGCWNLLTFTSVPAGVTVSVGQLLNNASPNFGGILLDKAGSFTGTCTGSACNGTTWHVQCVAPAAAYCSNATFTLPLGGGQSVAQTVSLSVPNEGATESPTATLVDSITGPAGFEMGHMTFTSTQAVTNSLIDKTGGTAYWEAIGNTCANAVTFSNNFDLINSATNINSLQATSGGC